MKVCEKEFTGIDWNGCKPKVCPTINYIRQALGNRADLLLNNLVIKNGRLFDGNYLESVPTLRTVKFTFDGQIIPPLLLINPDEVDKLLSFYEVKIFARHSERYRQFYGTSEAAFAVIAQSSAPRSLRYLNNYLLILKPNGKMILIIDDHAHAAYGLALANRLDIFDKQAVLFQIDEHEDNVINSKLHKMLSKNPSLEEIARCCKTELEIRQYLALACHIGLFEERNINYVLTENITGEMEPLKSSEERRLAGGNFLPLIKVPECVQKIKVSGRKIVMSLDLDFFAYLQDPLFPLKKKEAIQNFTEGQALSIIKELARDSCFIIIATSPDYFNVPINTTKRLIKAMVAAT